MKKVLFFAVTAVTTFVFSSCAENCTCTESQTGTEVDATYFSCDAYEDLLNEEADDQGASWQNWNCR
ncbi:MAG: hypothetical protein J6B07_05090 [Opitutales bacterium]|nr:hypothetical protein [Opitutales bacterium]